MKGAGGIKAGQGGRKTRASIPTGRERPKIHSRRLLWVLVGGGLAWLGPLAMQGP